MKLHLVRIFLVAIICAPLSLRDKPAAFAGTNWQTELKPEAAPNGGAKGVPSITEKAKGLEELQGFFPLYWDAKSGRMWLEINRWDKEFLYIESLPAGVGSNDIGLDRGQLGASRVVRFERSGPKVLLIEPNYNFRAISDNPQERESVRQAFAESVLWGFKVEAEEGSRVLVDGTDFFLRDAHHVGETLKRAKQGDYRVDPSRSALYLPRTKNFPRNTEVEATLTLTGENSGSWLSQVVPSPEAVTVREHTFFVELPDPGYRPRVFDPRAGFFGIAIWISPPRLMSGSSSGSSHVIASKRRIL